MTIVLFPGFIVLGAFISVMCWLWVAYKISDDGMPRRLIIGLYLALASFILVDVIILLGYLLHINAEVFKLLLTFMMGLQIGASVNLAGHVSAKK